MKKDNSAKEVIQAWNSQVAKLPPVDDEEIYTCKKCSWSGKLEKTVYDIGKFGVDVECPECNTQIVFIPLGSSKYD